MNFFPEPQFLEPEKLQVFHYALNTAWHAVVTADPSIATRELDVKLVLAAGILQAAKTGEGNVETLAKAACTHWAAAPHEREAVDFLLTLH